MRHLPSSKIAILASLFLILSFLPAAQVLASEEAGSSFFGELVSFFDALVSGAGVELEPTPALTPNDRPDQSLETLVFEDEPESAPMIIPLG